MQRYSSSAPEPISAHPYPAVPKTVGLTLGNRLFLLPEVCGEHIREAVVDIERRFEVHFSVNYAAIQLRRDRVGFTVHLRQMFPDHIPVEVDRGHALDIALVGDLIAVSVEAVTHTAVGYVHLGASELGHMLESGDVLPSAVQADLAVHIDGKTVLGGADALGKRLMLIKEIQQKSDHISDLLGVFSGGASTVVSFSASAMTFLRR